MDNRLKLYNTAVESLNKDMAPQEDEFGCAEALNNVFAKTFDSPIGGGTSTYRMYLILKSDKRFEKTKEFLPGDIIISPTGYGNGKLSNGHVGIVGENTKIMSNNSSTKLWDTFYTLETWKRKFKDYGGFPMDCFRVLTPKPMLTTPPSVNNLTPEQHSAIAKLLIAFGVSPELVFKWFK